ncbi:MAG TPA: transposase [candidate division Zixibacteria bacterium]|nr:transposase [candidate division Zixibacteria bacterium]
MTRLKRHFVDGYPCFITLVTHERLPVLVDNVELLHEAIAVARTRLEFTVIAWAILPNHLHAIISSDHANIPDIVHCIKLSFGQRYRRKHDLRKGKIWQDRYWDHMVRDQHDLEQRINYINRNPVKHGLCKSPFDWEHSSAKAFLESGHYQEDWGAQ